MAATNLDLFEKLKRVNLRNKLLLDGYFRNCQKELFQVEMIDNAYFNIPEISKSICLLYYGLSDAWDPKYVGDTYKLLDNQTIKHVGEEGFGNVKSAYGTAIISDGEYHWKFTIKKYSAGANTWSIVIGIWKTTSSPTPPIEHYTWFTRYGNGYGFVLGDGKLVVLRGNTSENTKYAKDYVAADGDIIDMYLDLNKATLSYTINGTDYGVARNVERTSYRAAVIACYPGSTIEIS